MGHISSHDTAFAVSSEHPLRDVHRWLTTHLESLNTLLYPSPPWMDATAPQRLWAHVRQEPAAVQINVLLACVERMAWHRLEYHTNPQQPAHFAIGSLLYELVCILYQRPLPYTEVQICTLLRSSKHLCGHGDDVIPPYRIAIRYARRAGLTPTLLEALQVFMESLPQRAGTNASILRSRARLLFVVAPQRLPGQRRCWSDGVREDLQRIAKSEYQVWSQLIVHMSVHNRSHGTIIWQTAAQKLLGTLGPKQVVERLKTWWPSAAQAAVWPLTPAGSHLLKHFIWLLGMIPANTPEALLAHQLVCDLTPLDWRRQSAGQKVMRAAATYLSTLPPAISWPALQQVQHWSQLVEDTEHIEVINAMVADYKIRYTDFIDISTSEP